LAAAALFGSMIAVPGGAEAAPVPLAGAVAGAATAGEPLAEKAQYYYGRPYRYRRHYAPRRFYGRRYYRPRYYRPRVVCRIRPGFYGPRRVCFRRY
jgi:hypothetical protein